MAQFQLTDADREEAQYWFPVGGRWADLRNDAEALRWWRPVREDPAVVLLRNGNLAFLELKLGKDGRIVSSRFLVDKDAEQAVSSWAFRPSEAFRSVATNVFRPGRLLTEAKADGAARLLVELRGEPSGTRRFDMERSGVIEVSVTPDGKVRSHKWLIGADALAALNADQDAEKWDVPALPGPISVRTRAEARLYAAVNAGDVEAERSVGDVFELFARTPEGPRRFQFSVEEPGDDPRRYGFGTSEALDPAELVLFAGTVVSGLPTPERAQPSQRPVHARKLKLAADGLREALKFIPSGESAVPKGVFHTKVGEFLHARSPERFTRAHLVSEAARLDALAAEWSK